MKIYSHNVKDGYLDLAFGNNTPNTNDIVNGINLKSFHIAWEDLPENTKSIALVFDDPDAIPVCGFCWIHWGVINIDPQLMCLEEDTSRLQPNLIQSKTSWSSPLLGNESDANFSGYGGCAPPDKTHTYQITVYALDTMLDLKPGYWINEFYQASEGHILATACLKMKYPVVK